MKLWKDIKMHLNAFKMLKKSYDTFFSLFFLSIFFIICRYSHWFIQSYTITYETFTTWINWTLITKPLHYNQFKILHQRMSRLDFYAEYNFKVHYFKRKQTMDQKRLVYSTWPWISWVYADNVCMSFCTCPDNKSLL